MGLVLDRVGAQVLDAGEVYQRRICRPTIITSPAARHVITHADIVFGIRQHRAIGSLPFGFVGSRKKKLMVVTTADLSKTMLMPATDFKNYSKNLTLRELSGTTVNE